LVDSEECKEKNSMKIEKENYLKKNNEELF
jgi:hypothetical protein